MTKMKAIVFRSGGKWYTDECISLPDDLDQNRAAYKKAIQHKLHGRLSGMTLVGEYLNEVPFLIRLD